MKKYIGLLLLAFLWISCHHEPQHLTKITAKTNPIDSILQQDSAIIKTFSPYKKKMIDEVNRVVSYAPENLTARDGKLQSTLGNLMADLMYEKANELLEKETGKKVDFALSNHKGIRASLWQGDIKVVDAFNIMPFENTLVVAELTKEKTEELFEYFVATYRAHPLSKQVQVIIGKGDTIEITINGEPLKDGRTYFVATSSYLQKGGDNMTFFLNPESLYDSNFLLRNAMIEYFEKQDTLVAKLDDRVIVRE
jgi:5'-nucleotidase